MTLTGFWRLLSCLVLSLFAVLYPALAQQLETYGRAESLIRHGQIDEGIALLKPLLGSDPHNLKALNLLGIALTSKGDLPAANREFKAALQADPHFLPALQNLAVNEFMQKDLPNAEKHFQQAAKSAPDDPTINGFLGRIAFARDDFALASRYLTRTDKLLAQDPSLAFALIHSDLEIGKDDDALAVISKLDARRIPLRAQFQLALSLAQHDHYLEATPFFEAVDSKYPDSYDAGFNLAICYVQTKHFAKAAELLLRLKNSGHKTAELDNLLAEAYEGSNQLQPAIDALREATQLAPEDENNYIDLATLCIDHDAFDLGLDVIEVGLHYNPQSDRLIFQRGILHAMKNEFDLADQDFQLASKLAPEKNLSYVGLGISYMQTGNLPEAIHTLRQRVDEKPSDPMLQYLLGEALVRSGANPGEETFSEAKTALEKSVSLNASFSASRVILAKLYLRENRINEAVAHLEKAIALDATDKAAYSQLALAYRRQGHAEKATPLLAALAKLNEDARAKESRGRTRLVKKEPASTAPTP
ncbi:MAG TPA: tetratricopeptide repeat protein [Candidatus Acidoferrum sp.]|nr:tetratricopeptide repeat protein [Candidatus Acidoferrum sp.]